MSTEDFLESLGFKKTEWNTFANSIGYEVSLVSGLTVVNPDQAGVHEEPKPKLYLNYIPENEVIRELFESSGFLF